MPQPGTVRTPRVASFVPQFEKSGCPRALMDFGFVPRKTEPLEVCTLCCLCELLPNAVFLTPELSLSRIGWEMQSYPA